MRLTLSRKVFLVFFPLALVTAFLGVVLVHGVRGLRVTAEEITSLHEFRLRVQRLESLSQHKQISPQRFQQVSVEALQRLEALQRARADLPLLLRRQLTELVDHLGYYRSAFDRLAQLQAADADLHQQCHRLLEEMFALAMGGGAAGSNASVAALVQLSLWWADEPHGEEVASAAYVARLKRIAQPLRNPAANSGLATLAERFVLAVENRYLDGLERAQQQRYLRDSEQRFHDVATRAIAALQQSSRDTLRQLHTAIVAAIVSAVALTLLLWFSTTRYLGRFLRHTRSVMQGIRGGTDVAALDRVSDDELGDLAHFMTDVARDLSYSMARTEASEEKYRSLVENTSDWVWEVDGEWRFVYSSPAVRGILGLDAAEVLGRRVHDLLQAEGAPPLDGAPAHLPLEQLRVQSVSTVARHSNGEYVTVETSWGVVRDGAGEVHGYRGITRDVSERRRADEERQRLEEQLVQAQKMEAIGTLSGGIAHDFNNLLQSIGGYAELLLHRCALQGADEGALHKIVAATERASQLTQQMLLLSRRIKSSCQVIALNDVISRCQELLRHSIPRMIDFRLHLAADLPAVKADPLQIEQVLMNLVFNARDAMPGGGVIEIDTELARIDPFSSRPQPHLAPGSYVVLRLTDDGEGMSPEVCERVFEPFFTTKEVGKGTGLGLAMAYGIMRNHEGHISCSSQPGRGTTFTLYFPVASDAGVVEEAGGRGDIVAAAVLGGSETILLVDDEELIRGLGAEFLEDAGYRVLTADSGEAALEQLRLGDARVDLVLLDLNMPGMGGRQCMEHMLRSNPHLKILITSGYADPENGGQGTLSRARGWVRKPFRLQYLLRVVRAALEAP